MPSNLKVVEWVAEVIDLIKEENGYKAEIKISNQKPHILPYVFDYVLLATGHATAEAKDSMHTDDLVRSNGCAHVPVVYPVDHNLNVIVPQSTVGIKGMGLTFVDAVLALTEGRGGRFGKDLYGSLHYQASGLEPRVIIPFSKSGIPMIPRLEMKRRKKRALRFFTPQRVAQLHRQKRKIDFEEDIWPLLSLDFYHTFYCPIFETYAFSAGFSERTSISAAILLQGINDFHRAFPQVQRFDLEKFLIPTKGEVFDSASAFHDFIEDYLKTYTEQAKYLADYSPLIALTTVWSSAAPLFGKIYAHGGLSPLSQADFISRYVPLLNRVSYGPPLSSMEKILTLSRQGIIDFSFATDMTLEETDKNEVTITSQIDGTSQNLDTLINARVPKTHLPSCTSGLYHKLLTKGEIRLFENIDQHGTFTPGCLSITYAGFVRDINGRINRAIAATGTPTEGILFDNDALSPTRNNVVNKWCAIVINELIKKYNNESSFS